MYIIELIVKLLNKNKVKKINMPEKDYEKCEHVFLPIDSTNQVLACSKCGYVIHKNDMDIKSKNPFEN